MRMNIWFSIMHVMSRLGIFRPYTIWVDQFLNTLNYSFEHDLQKSKEWILNHNDYPHLEEFRSWYGIGWENIIKEMLTEGDIILDDNVIVFTGINSPKLQKFVDESIRVGGKTK